MAPFIAKMMRFSPSTPEKIAKKIHKVINSDDPPLRVPVTVDALIFGLIRKLLPRKIYHTLMYYSLPKIYRWGEDEHYHMDAEYERRENQKLLESPMKPVIVVYDGDCGLCEKCRKLLEKLDWFNQFECHPLQEKDLYLKFPALKADEFEKELKLIVSPERIYGGADAVIKICFRLPLVMPLGWLFWMPPFRQMARRLYPKIAANRYRISSQCGIENRKSRTFNQ